MTSASLFIPNQTTWQAATGLTQMFGPIYFDDADVTLSGETPTFRLRAQCATNATQPTQTLTVGLHAITACAGGANTNTLTVTATAVTGSGVAFTSPAASTLHQGVTSAFTVPADGFYTFGLTTSAAMTANSAALIGAQLQVKVAD